MKIASLFAGCGGLDLGFEKAGFNVIWANEYDKTIWETYEKNHKNTILDKRSIIDIKSEDIPEIDGIIGGPPCQSWSEAGSQRGIDDKRGQLFFEFIRILKDKKPKFFLAENVSGILLSKHTEAFNNIKTQFINAGYNLYIETLNASDYGVAQDRKRVFFVGIRTDISVKFEFPQKDINKKVLQDVIKDLGEALPVKKNKINKDLEIPNHEYLVDTYSSMYMSRNRVRGWYEPSFTILASGRHIPLHPQAPKMELVKKDERQFVKGYESLYRRLSVRECAIIQGFPNNFIFYYTNILNGYKMVGNAVPVDLGYNIAKAIKKVL